MEQKIICPICGSENSSFFYKKNEYDLYVCQNCQVGFVWPLPDNSADIYEVSYFNGGLKNEVSNKFGYTNYEEDKKAMETTFINYLEEISKLTAGRSIMDIGAATGYFLDLARRLGWKTGGVEISAYAAKIAGEKGHKIFLGSLEKLNIAEKYDVVTMWDVLEHLASPKEYLKSIYNILNPEGLLAINTVDRSSCWAKILGKRWQAIVPPEHLFYYSSKSLSELLKQSGFEIIKQAKIGKKFTLPYICKILVNRYNMKNAFKFFNFLSKGCWKKIYIPINLRDNIFIIARKIQAF